MSGDEESVGRTVRGQRGRQPSGDSQGLANNAKQPRIGWAVAGQV